MRGARELKNEWREQNREKRKEEEGEEEESSAQCRVEGWSPKTQRDKENDRELCEKQKVEK